MAPEECCKRLKIEKSYEYSTFYSELCSFLPYLNEDDEFDGKIHLMMFPLEVDPYNERAVFSLTSEGERYVKEQIEKRTAMRHAIYQSIIATIAVIIAIIGVVATIVLT